jgi:uracil-DNA glycosylase family 4
VEEKNRQAHPLGNIAKEIKTCTKCHLSRTRKNAVPGEGDREAEIMFVGEAPGYWEDTKARPFVGQAGQLLDNLLKEIGLERGKVYITNIVKCRPPNNRDPQPDEINTCIPYLFKQIELIKPSVICTLGRFAFKVLSEENRASITAQHGKPYKKETFTIFPLYHPAAALHQPRLLDVLKEDFIKLHTFLTSPPPDKPEEEKKEEGKKAKQMDLFT